ncbi:MAG: hypothetical protein IJ184_07165, partial [Alphaproteobacteria bacterium]|nr:hypothetical protein [Alphaproteobacteria bacterium]
MAWEIENTGVVSNQNKDDEPQWEIEHTQPVTQSVLDVRDNKMYNVPLAFDGVDTTYAIDTEHKGKNKDDYFCKVEMFDDLSSPWDLAEKAIKALPQVSQMFDKKIGAVKRGVYDNLEMWSDYLWTKMASFQLSGERMTQKMVAAGEDAGTVNKMTLLEDFDTKEDAQELVKELRKFREITHGMWEQKREKALKSEDMNTSDKAVQQLINSFLQGGESMATMFVTGNPVAGAVLMGTVYGDLKRQGLWEEAIAQGRDVEQAEAIGFVGGTIEGGIEMLGDVLAAGFAKIAPIRKITDQVIKKTVLNLAEKPIGKTLINMVSKKSSKHLTSALKEGTKGALSEGTEELLQGLMGDWFSNTVGLSDIEFGDSLSEAFLSFLMAVPVGGLMAGGGTAMYNRMVRKTNNKIKETLQKANPEVSEDEIQKVADGLQEVFYQDAAGAYMKELNRLVEKQSNLMKMPENFTDITTATTKMLKEKFNMSDEEIEKTVKIAANSIDARNAFATAYNSFRDELELQGRNPALADREARLYAARITAIAKAEGVKVEDVLKERSLRVARMKFADFMANRNPEQRSMEISREDYVRLKNIDKVKAPKDNRMSLLEYIKSKGGLKDAGGELKTMDADKQFKGLVNNKDGAGFDDMAQSAW